MIKSPNYASLPCLFTDHQVIRTVSTISSASCEENENNSYSVQWEHYHLYRKTGPLKLLKTGLDISLPFHHSLLNKKPEPTKDLYGYMQMQFIKYIY